MKTSAGIKLGYFFKLSQNKAKDELTTVPIAIILTSLYGRFLMKTHMLPNAILHERLHSGIDRYGMA